MKIIFMPYLPITKQDYVNLGIEYFVNKEYDVSILESHNILFPNYKQTVDINYFIPPIEQYEPDTEDLLLQYISKLTSQDFIIYYIAGKESIKLLNNIRLHTQVKMLTYISGSIPLPKIKCISQKEFYQSLFF